jgi:hypothetical protein
MPDIRRMRPASVRIPDIERNVAIRQLYIERGCRRTRSSATANYLVDNGLFRVLQPRSLGGVEPEPMTYNQVVEQIAAPQISETRGQRWNSTQPERAAAGDRDQRVRCAVQDARSQSSTGRPEKAGLPEDKSDRSHPDADRSRGPRWQTADPDPILGNPLLPSRKARPADPE